MPCVLHWLHWYFMSPLTFTSLHHCLGMKTAYTEASPKHSCRSRVNKHFISQDTNKRAKTQTWTTSEQRYRPNQTAPLAQTRLLQRIRTGQAAPKERLLCSPSPSQQPQPKPAPRYNGAKRQTHVCI